MRVILRVFAFVLLTAAPAFAYGMWWPTSGNGQATEQNHYQAYQEARQQAVDGIVCLSGNVRGVSELSRNDNDNGDGTWTVSVGVIAQCWVGN